MNRHPLLIPLLLMGLLSACQDTRPNGVIIQGGTSGGHQATDDLSTDWSVTVLAEIDVDGLLQVNPKSVIDGTILHLFYYQAHSATDEADSARYDLMYLPWDLELNQALSMAAPVVSLDNNNTLSVGHSAEPLVAYQGGASRECQGEEQSDAMIAEYLQGWQEKTAAIGLVERTAPILEDGLAGGHMSLAVDANGNQHLSFQFFYEGCDQNPFVYPDLHYVQLYAGVDGLPPEQVVDGNVLATQDDANYNRLVGVGDFNQLLLNEQGQPLIVYSANDPESQQRGLKLASISEGAWRSEWLITHCVVEGLSAALDHQQQLAIAVYTTSCNEGLDADPQLHYLWQANNSWHQQTINMAQRAGQFPSLIFDEQDRAHIAFYEIESYQHHPLRNLRLIRQQADGDWAWVEVSNLDDVGRYNQLHLLDDELLIVSYAASEQKILLFRPQQ